MIDIEQARFASDGAAWKTPSMRGYIKKTALDESAYGEGAFKLTFVKADGTAYDFYYDVKASASASDATNLVLDGELLRHILSSNWQSGNAADYEAARGGTGNW